MTTTTPLRTALQGSRALTILAGVMSAIFLISIVGLVADDRLLGGQPIWLKPAKFSVSLGVYGFTLAWLMAYLRRGRRVAQWSGIVIAAATYLEMAIIVGQVIRGRVSHFNEATLLDMVLWRSLGGLTVALSLGTIVIAVLLWRHGMPDRAGTWAIRLGIVLLMGGFLEAFLMVIPTPDQIALAERGLTTNMGAHAVGVPDGGPGMPLTGWSTTGGDLRIGHFVGLHGLQAILLFTMLVTWLVKDAVRRTHLVFVFAFAYGGLFVLVTWQALRAQPLLAPDSATITALLALAAATALAATVSWLRPLQAAGR
ncbi:hypothetical protein [Actinopolymorpha alba]|uniref:hypothetical protein n=1 Tax=Actinopolymorpha alba TaxID=533267 RepID=UPI00058DD8E9|nr:hypothetical protein [Actinopolymorpha alba]